MGVHQSVRFRLRPRYSFNSYGRLGPDSRALGDICAQGLPIGLHLMRRHEVRELQVLEVIERITLGSLALVCHCYVRGSHGLLFEKGSHRQCHMLDHDVRMVLSMEYLR